MNIRVVSIGILFIALLAFLMIQGIGDGTSSVFLPSELLAQEQELSRVRVAGRVTADPVNYQVQPNFRLEFTISDPNGKNPDKLAVVYQGIKPDMFAPGRDVIIDGRFQSGKIVAAQLLTQCPSKYEPPKPEQ